jgi:hypothetical protein
VSVNEKKWLVMHMHVQLQLDDMSDAQDQWPCSMSCHNLNEQCAKQVFQATLHKQYSIDRRLCGTTVALQWGSTTAASLLPRPCRNRPSLLPGHHQAGSLEQVQQ